MTLEAAHGIQSQRQILLLRGVNVGGNSKVAMPDLRRIVAGVGGTDVVTHLNSGNVICTSSTSPEVTAAAVEVALEAELGRRVPIVARTPEGLARVVERNPLRDIVSNPSRYYIGFLSAEPDPARLQAALTEAERIGQPDRGEQWRIEGREIYQWIPAGVHESKLPNAFSDKRLGVIVTGRNWNTVEALLTLATR
jgi:uncharacterized protein (DUF1697 family)